MVKVSSMRDKWVYRYALASCLLVWAVPGADAGPPAAMPPGAAAAGDDAAKGDKDKPDFPPFDEVSKDHKEVPVADGESPFFRLYYNEKTDHMLAIIPKSLIGKNFLMASSISGGPIFAGWMWGDQVVQWHEMDKKLVLIEPDLRYKSGEKTNLEDVIRRTYTDRIVLSTPIVSKKDGDPVIDLDQVFKKDVAGLSSAFEGAMDSSLSRWAKKKVFPHNVELAVDAAMMQSEGTGQRARVHFSLSELPETDYQPREADNRVGYFLTAVKDWTKEHDADTVFRRLIHRWRLRKEDPAADVSDVKPEDQIIFYVEKTVPKQFRQYVREGILEWNKAFEKAGLRNAIAVRQQTDTVFNDIDPEDVRYNFFRWIVSGRAFAMGPSRANPLTGQILDADIVWDDALVRAWTSQYARYSGTGGAGLEYDPWLAEFLDLHPQWRFTPQEQVLLPKSYAVGGVDLSWQPGELDAIKRLNNGFCNYAVGMTHELALGGAVIAAEGAAGAVAEKYLGQLIKHVVSHEVGHTLGLRHNFKASSWKTMDDLTAADGEHATCGSVMDYNPAIFGDDIENQSAFVSPTVGPYDDWAIEFGYRAAKPDDKEDEMLAEIAGRCAQPGLAYATDEDTMFFAPDPLVNRYDAGDDALRYAKQRMALVKKLQADMPDWAVKDGDGYNRVRRMFDMLLFEYSRVSQFAARYIGGQYVHRDQKGDPGARPPFEIVPVEKQTESLDFLVANVFDASAFNFDPELLNKLAPGRWEHWESDAFDSMLEYPVHDRIAAVQFSALFQVLNPFTLTRIYDAELKVPADDQAMTVPTVMTRLTGAVWSELTGNVNGNWTERKPFVPSIRRSLQWQHLNVLLDVLLSEPGRMMPADVHAVTRMTLKGLSAQMADVLKAGDGKLDPASEAHLDAAKTRIDRALEAEFEL